jgi:hypothetical protein
MNDIPWGKCQTCKHFSSPALVGWAQGECRRNAPRADDRGRNAWPFVDGARDRTCGEYSAAEWSVEAIVHAAACLK